VRQATGAALYYQAEYDCTSAFLIAPAPHLPRCHSQQPSRALRCGARQNAVSLNNDGTELLPTAVLKCKSACASRRLPLPNPLYSARSAHVEQCITLPTAPVQLLQMVHKHQVSHAQSRGLVGRLEKTVPSAAKLSGRVSPKCAAVTQPSLVIHEHRHRLQLPSSSQLTSPAQRLPHCCTLLYHLLDATQPQGHPVAQLTPLPNIRRSFNRCTLCHHLPDARAPTRSHPAAQPPPCLTSVFQLMHPMSFYCIGSSTRHLLAATTASVE
jgi:hypothetical protein